MASLFRAGSYPGAAGDRAVSRIADAAYGDRPYPESPGFKERTTSRDAAAAIGTKAKTLRGRVLDAIAAAGDPGLTADEAAARISKDWRAIRPRVTELAATGKIEPTGETRQNDTGLFAKVYRIKR
jgi:hypothetical protein